MLIEFKPPKKLDESDKRFIREHNDKKKKSCEHGHARFEYSERRREIFCRECEERVDPFTAFMILGKNMNRTQWEHKELMRYRLEEDIKEARHEAEFIQREFAKPPEQRRICNDCKLPLVRRHRQRDYWECLQCRWGCVERLLSKHHTA